MQTRKTVVGTCPECGGAVLKVEDFHTDEDGVLETTNTYHICNCCMVEFEPNEFE